MIDAICHELTLQHDYLGKAQIQSIYFGGGTPSLLNADEIYKIIQHIHQRYSVVQSPEITLEANPDDLSPSYLEALMQSGINRLSIGIQSFDEKLLQSMNRAHNAVESSQVLTWVKAAGFNNYSVDLIYGIPADDHSIWANDLKKMLAYDPPHISAYCLTIEEKTVFGQWLKKGKIREVTEEFAATQFEMLLESLIQAGYEQYEISNFCKPGCQAVHNSHYWQQVPYLGIGPSAHSYNGISRQHNIAQNAKYTRAISNGEIPAVIDKLSREDQANEYILTSLRTTWGTDLQVLEDRYAYPLLQLKRPYIEKLIENGFLLMNDNKLYLTSSGRLLADKIAADLFAAFNED